MDIPEDVQIAAEAAQDAAIARCKAADFAVYEYPFNTGRAKDVLDEEIARAILAERDRATAAEREACLERVDFALLDFRADEPDGFARGHAHAKTEAMRAIRAIRNPPEQPA